jgi:MFS family permease
LSSSESSTTFPVFYAPLIDEFGWTRAQVTAGFFYGILIIGPIFGISAGFLIDRYGTKRILLAGLIAAGIGFLGFSSMHSLGIYYIFYFMETVGYVSGGPVPNQVLISHWFNRMRGRAMGLAYVGIGGRAVAPVRAVSVATPAGDRNAHFRRHDLPVPGTAGSAGGQAGAELGLRPDLHRRSLGGAAPSGQLRNAMSGLPLADLSAAPRA